MSAGTLPALTQAQARELRVVAANAGAVRQSKLSDDWMLFKNKWPLATLPDRIVSQLLTAGVVRTVPTPPSQHERISLALTNIGRAWLAAHPEPKA